MISRFVRRILFGATSHDVERKVARIERKVVKHAERAKAAEDNVGLAITALGAEQGALNSVRGRLEKMIGK